MRPSRWGCRLCNTTARLRSDSLQLCYLLSPQLQEFYMLHASSDEWVILFAIPSSPTLYPRNPREFQREKHQQPRAPPPAVFAQPPPTTNQDHDRDPGIFSRVEKDFRLSPSAKRSFLLFLVLVRMLVRYAVCSTIYYIADIRERREQQPARADKSDTSRHAVDVDAATHRTQATCVCVCVHKRQECLLVPVLPLQLNRTKIVRCVQHPPSPSRPRSPLHQLHPSSVR